VRSGITYDVERIAAGSGAVVRYAEAFGITPNDSAANRGAYLAIGFVADRRLPLHVTANCVSYVSQLTATLQSRLTARGSLPEGARLRDVAPALRVRSEAFLHQCSPLVRVDLVQQAAYRCGQFESASRQCLSPADLGLDTDVRSLLLYCASETADASETLERYRAEIESVALQAASAVSALSDESIALDDIRRVLDERSRAMLGIASRIAKLDEQAKRLRRMGSARPVESRHRAPSRTAVSPESSESPVPLAVPRPGQSSRVKQSRWGLDIRTLTQPRGLVVVSVLAAVLVGLLCVMLWWFSTPPKLASDLAGMSRDERHKAEKGERGPAKPESWRGDVNGVEGPFDSIADPSSPGGALGQDEVPPPTGRPTVASPSVSAAPPGESIMDKRKALDRR